MSNDEIREALRQDLILTQCNDAEAGLEMILDGTYKVDMHLRNALEIVKDAHQGTALAEALGRSYQMRLTMWGTLGLLNSDRIRGER